MDIDGQYAKLGCMKGTILLTILLTLNCGYRLVNWDNSDYKSVYVKPVITQAIHRPHAALFQHALNDRCLAMSGLNLVSSAQADLILETTLHDVSETIIATDIDRRVRQVQFTLTSSFKLVDKQGVILWEMKNYQFSDQYEVSTSRGVYKNDAASSMNLAYRNIAEMVVTHFSVYLNQHERQND